MMVPKRDKKVQCQNTFTFLLKRSFLIKYFSGKLLFNLFFHIVLQIILSNLTRLLKTMTCYKEIDLSIFSSGDQYSDDLSYLLVGLAHISSSVFAFHLRLLVMLIFPIQTTGFCITFWLSSHQQSFQARIPTAKITNGSLSSYLIVNILSFTLFTLYYIIMLILIDISKYWCLPSVTFWSGFLI